MGFFGGYLLDGHGWRSFEPFSEVTMETLGPWLSLEIFDSDFVVIRYFPPGPGSGSAYLGCTPRSYWDNESESAPTDVQREAAGLAAWLPQFQDRSDEAGLQELIEPFLASDEDDDFDDLDDGEEDPAEIFAEIKAARFLHAVGLPVPDDLARR